MRLTRLRRFRPHGQVGDKTTTGDVVAALGFGTPMHAGLVLTCGFRGHISFDADDGLDAIGTQLVYIS